MDVARKIFLWLAGFLLGPMLILFVGIWGLNRTIGSPEHVKDVSRETQIYETISNFIIDEIKDQSGSVGDDKLLQQVVSDTVNPNNLEGVTVNAVDVAYDILDGTTDPKDFTIDVSELSNTLIANTKVQLKEKLLTLDPCTSFNPPKSVNPFEFNCLPFGDDVNAYVEMAIMLMKQENVVLKTGEININTLNLDDGEKASKAEVEKNIETLRNVSSFYQGIQKIYWMAIIITLISTVLVVVLSKEFIRGLKRVGLIYFLNGVLIVAIAAVTSYSVDKIISNKDDPLLPADAFQLAANQIISDYASVVLKMGLAVAVLGAATALAAILMIRKQHPKIPEDEMAKTATKSKNQTLAKATNKAKEPVSKKSKQNVKAEKPNNSSKS
ncbi:MAG: hypothetical protein M3P98_00195 [bacterium]|nr:hypothetical protein [bacterium]